jgi:hypothetical protein
LVPLAGAAWAALLLAWGSIRGGLEVLSAAGLAALNATVGVAAAVAIRYGFRRLSRLR